MTELEERHMTEPDAHEHPLGPYLRPGRVPHIWCPGCGLGSVLASIIKGVERAGLKREKTVFVSGIGCTGRIAGYLYFDSYHSTHGRAIPFAIGLKLANPELNVCVVSGDGDLFAIGGNHFIHAARRNVNIKVVCVNNFNYGMTGGQGGPTTPIGGRTTTTPFGNYEHPFNLPYVAAASGAVYVARWTSLHLRELEGAVAESFLKKGFTFIEVVAPCPTSYGRPNKIGGGLDELKFYREHCIVKHGANPLDADIGLKTDIVIGKFIDIPAKRTFLDEYGTVLASAMGVRE